MTVPFRSIMADELSEEEDSNLARQYNEAALLKSMYEDDFFLLSASGQPVECIIRLWSGNKKTRFPAELSHLDLHVKCPEDYPIVPPDFQIKNLHKIAAKDVTLLRQELIDSIDSLKGEVLIYELTLHCQKFVRDYSTSETLSFYESMMSRNRDLANLRAKELQKIQEDEKRKRRELANSIQNKERTLRAALRRKSKSEEEDDICLVDTVPYPPPARDEETVVLSEEGLSESLYTPWKLLKEKEKDGSSRLKTDFEIIEKLGSGAFGQVFKVMNKLDGCYYAIKKIILNCSNKRAHREITREIKLLSRLNHENVVRYYNSWVEFDEGQEEICANSVIEIDDGEIDDAEIDEAEIDDVEWSEPMQVEEEGDDSFIVFRDDQEGEPGEPGSREAGLEEIPFSQLPTRRRPTPEELTVRLSQFVPSAKSYYMCIQMELCDNSTLKNAIDEDHLYKDRERAWRLFREIVEGLCHIHDQKIMHRDLKPPNIFLDRNDQVKIGDFGLAKASRSHKSVPAIDLDNASADTVVQPEDALSQEAQSHTGYIGTALYKAPELNRIRSSKRYNEKVDVYSLGIIFFEMSCPPFPTGSEKVRTIMRLGKPDIAFPKEFPFGPKSNEYKLIKSMLNHNVDERPFARDILATECVASLKRGEGEVMAMIQRTLSNPQSKDYKYLIASCINQTTPAAFEATYDMSTFRQGRLITVLSTATELLRDIFRRYGAVSFAPPLLTPGPAPSNGVTVMTSVGGIVHATPDLQAPFARYVVQNPTVTNFRRYTIEKVYQEMPVGIHPKETIECAYDIVSTSRGVLMPDLELLVVVRDIVRAFPLLRNPVLYLNHSDLIKMVLDICVASSPTSLSDTTFQQELIQLLSENPSKTALRNYLTRYYMSEACISMMLSWVDLKESSPQDILSQFSNVLEQEEQIGLCSSVIRQLNCLTKEIKSLSIDCPVIIKPSLVANPSRYSGLMFQLFCDNDKPKRGSTQEKTVVLTGGQYDGFLRELQMKIPSKDASKPLRCASGFVLYLESLANLMMPGFNDITLVADAVFCVLGTSSAAMTKDHVSLIKELWTTTIRIYFVDSVKTMDEAQNICKQVGANVLLIVKENDPSFVRLRTVGRDGKTAEKKLPLNEVAEYLTLKLFKHQDTVTIAKPIQSSEMFYITIFGNEKMGNVKIYQNQIRERLASVALKFSPDTRIEVLAFPTKGLDLINFLGSTIEFDDPMVVVDSACKKFPNMKKMIQQAAKHINDVKTAGSQYVILLYSLVENMYRVIL
ncbi:Eukaryotic translation initiation factor 2-alpha kinase [Nesidiocoris tenuis]|uniref:non-specific serine/threonine protein kinase n=1 Tax=Nesidiocoris tenuis TaxID=355587 RepID=A0ABN7ADD9_9HEMI|nr:Eukaryotic translation initiation factor 2-alpha kinase [Nesidiocoris tenuis]